MRGQHSLRCRAGGTWMRYVLSHRTRRARGLPATLAMPVLAVGAVEAPLRRLPVALAGSTQHLTTTRTRARLRAVLLPAVALRTDLGLRATNPADEHALTRGRTLDRSLQSPGSGPARPNPRCSASPVASSDAALVGGAAVVRQNCDPGPRLPPVACAFCPRTAKGPSSTAPSSSTREQTHQLRSWRQNQTQQRRRRTAPDFGGFAPPPTCGDTARATTYFAAFLT